MPKKSTPPMVRLTFSIEEEDYKALEALAEKEDRSMAWILRKAFRQLLDGTQVNEKYEGNGR